MTRLMTTTLAGVRIGHGDDERLVSGVTAILFDRPAVAAHAVLGGAAATRDTDCLSPDATVPAIDAIVLSGGSGFGLDAASGVQAYLREHDRGFPVGAMHVPIVPSAVLFDLTNGGDKKWGRYPPYRDLGYAAAQSADASFELGSVGAGLGAGTVTLKGGFGAAETTTASGHTVFAVAAVNALGSAVIGPGPHFWAAPYERDTEFGGLGLPPRFTADDVRPAWKGAPAPATTIAAVVTDATLDKARARRLAVAAHDGLARSLRVAHAALDGDTVFLAATGANPAAIDAHTLTELGVAAADSLARAVATAVYEARRPATWNGPPAWRDLFGRG